MTSCREPRSHLAIYYEVWMLQVKVHYQLLISSFTFSLQAFLFSLRPAWITSYFSTISAVRPYRISTYIKSPRPQQTSFFIFTSTTSFPASSQHIQDLLSTIRINTFSTKSYVFKFLTPCLPTTPIRSQNPTHQTHVSQTLPSQTLERLFGTFH